MEQKNYFTELNSIDVNDKVEKKNGLTYLSWAYAWGEVKKRYPNANYKVYETLNGINYFTDGRTGWVKTGVIINDIEHIEYLPIMDYKNKSIPLEQITSFDVNKTIQRSLTKAVARHGLGLYIYAGEDLPEAIETSENKPLKVEVKEIKAEEKKTPKKAQKQSDNDFISTSELPFEKFMDKFVEVHKEEKDIEMLENLKEMINDRLLKIVGDNGERLRNAYQYYATNYGKNNFDELEEKDLRNIITDLDKKLEKRA